MRCEGVVICLLLGWLTFVVVAGTPRGILWSSWTSLDGALILLADCLLTCFSLASRQRHIDVRRHGHCIRSHSVPQPKGTLASVVCHIQPTNAASVCSDGLLDSVLHALPHADGGVPARQADLHVSYGTPPLCLAVASICACSDHQSVFLLLSPQAAKVTADQKDVTFMYRFIKVPLLLRLFVQSLACSLAGDVSKELRHECREARGLAGALRLFCSCSMRAYSVDPCDRTLWCSALV